MVVQHAKGAAGPDRMPVEIGEHLLGTLESLVQEKYDRDRLVGQRWVDPHRLLNRRATVLPIINKEPGVHRDVQGTEVSSRAAARLKHGLAVDGCGQRRKHIVLSVGQDIAGDLRYPGPVKDSLGADLGTELVLVEQEDLRDEPEGAH